MTTLLKIAGVLLLVFAISAPAPAPAQAAGTVYPIVDAETGYLLGGTANKLWLDAAQVAPLLKGGEPYRLYTLKGYMGTVNGAQPASAGAPCEDTQVLTLTPPVPVSGRIIGSGGPWKALPRLARSQSVNQQVYKDAVAAVLKAHGIAKPVVRITQLLRVDLDGDGVTEVLVTASSHVGGVQPRAQAGDYAVVLLRKVINGKVQTTLLESDFYPAAVEFAAPLEFTVSAIADLNGDGNMEIAVHYEYYEGAGTTVYEVKGSTVKEVLATGCGA
jgi:hypothetical protein